MISRRKIITGALAAPFIIPSAASACEFVTSFSSYSPPPGGGGSGSGGGGINPYEGVSNAEGIDGLDPVFLQNVMNMMSACASEFGGRMVIYSGYRSIERQRQLWEAALVRYGSPAAARKWVAPPGSSMHNFGLAVDMRHNGARMEWGQRVSSWALANEGRFNLVRPLNNEGWHFEPVGGRAIRDQMIAGMRSGGNYSDVGVQPGTGGGGAGGASCDEILRELPMVGLMPWGMDGDASAD